MLFLISVDMVRVSGCMDIIMVWMIMWVMLSGWWIILVGIGFFWLVCLWGV